MAMRQASGFGALYVATLNLLRLSVRKEIEGWRQLLGYSRRWVILAIGILVLCQTPFFLQGVKIMPGVPPGPVYGNGVYLFSAYLVLAPVVLLLSCGRDLRRTTGAERAEISFILIGGICSFVLSLVLAFVLDYAIGPSRAIFFAPFRVFVFSLVVGYGIATRKILEVGYFMRRGIALLLLVAYLVALYVLVWWPSHLLFFPLFGEDGTFCAHLLAALVVAMAMAPARGVSRSLADRLFVGTRRLDFQATMNQATAILRSVTTLADLLDRFGLTIGQAVDTERVFLLLPEPNFYAQQFPAVQTGARTTRIELHKDQAIIAYLERTQEPIILDELHRVRSTAELERVRKQMQSLQAGVAMGIFSREHLAGVMLLGPRRSGRIYGTVEQNALRVLCGQLAVAIENAQLFTEVQNAKIYNETLLQNLTTGVVAADRNEAITVFNHEIEEITGLTSAELLGRKISNLPEQLREVVRVTLESGERQADRELTLRTGDKATVLRASSSIFHSQTGEPLGALMVLTDITALKRLELQIRRSDRLASLGTLSAGMAHEIKNPLVSIKTFAQLLPERYQDSDFRETFFSLIGHEVDRIDSLVNQLLRFARPAKPLLKPMHVHEILEKALLLVGHRLYQKDVKLIRSWHAEVDTIRADADQIEQVFLNFFINALDAMKTGGSLTVSTDISSTGSWPTALPGPASDVQEILRVTVQDDGTGIKARRRAARFRSVLHHEGLRHRPRPLGRARHRAGTWRPDRGRERARSRHQFPHSPPPGPLSGRGCGGMISSGACLLYTQDLELVRRSRAYLRERALLRHVEQPDRLTAVLQQNNPALLLLDLRAREARDLLCQIQQEWPDVIVIALGMPDSDPLRDAEECGAYATEDVNLERRRFQSLVDRALDHLQVLEENRALRQAARPAATPALSLVPAKSADPSAGATPLPVLRFARAFHRSGDSDALMHTVVESLADAAMVSRVGLFARVRQSERYRLRVGLRCLPETSELEFRERDPLVRWLELRAHLVCRAHLEQTVDLAERQLLRRALDAFGAEVIVPLHADGRISGWLFFGHRLTGQPFDYSNLEGLMLLADHVSTVLANARLNEELTLQKTLAETLLEAIPPGIIAIDEEAIVRWCNPTAETILGLNASEVLGPAGRSDGQPGRRPLARCARK